jgi:4-nitrophenyl phosphatase
MSQPLRALILDMDGVLWRESEWLIHPAATFARVRQAGWQFAFATNNATQPRAHYLHKFEAAGVPLEPWQVMNSPLATAAYLKERHPAGGTVFIVGEAGLHETLAEEGFVHGTDSPVAVVAGLDRGITYEKLKIAGLLVRAGVPFIATNADRSFPTPEGQTPGAGALQAAITAASDVSPIVIGKPQPAMYHQLLRRLGTAPQETLVIGDRLETDIAGGQAIGCKTGLVLSGVTSAEQAARWQPAPDWIAANLDTLLDEVLP